MNHHLAFSVVYAAISLLRSSQAACTVPALWVFSLPEDLEPVYPGLRAPLFLVENGIVAEILRSAEIVKSSVLSIPNRINGFPITWCSTNPERAIYGLRMVSEDPASLRNPNSSVPLTGDITSTPFRFKVDFDCIQEVQQPIAVEITITISSGVTEYCPTVFYFSKLCNNLMSSAEADQSIEVVDGFLNETLDFKIPINIAGGAGVSAGIIVASTVIPSLLIFLGLAVLLIAWAVWYRSRSKSVPVFVPEAVCLAYQQVHSGWYPRGPHEKEYSQEKLELKRELGEGAFGIVYEGVAHGIVNSSERTTVAVKQLKSDTGSDQVEEFFREVDFMSKMDHPQVVQLLGVCSVHKPFSMIFEYMDLGDLCTFLREASGLCGNGEEDEASESLLSEAELLSIALQVVQGMVYISSLHLVHRDLATRNCLMATGLVAKIADFGMSRDIHSSDYYRVHGHAMLPVRWMSPESVLYGKFTSATDVWSFGVLLWEIFTFGQQPYMGLNNEEVIETVKEGRHPDIPNNCSVTDVMLKCWNRIPKNRPSFELLSQMLQDRLNGDGKHI